MALVAKCQFCSRPDNSIQVLCESRCLLCSRCQLIPGIRQLLTECVVIETIPHPTNPFGHSKHVAKGWCPICECPLSQSMIQVIQTFNAPARSSFPEEDGMSEMSPFDMVLDEPTTTITDFLKRYKLTYESDKVYAYNERKKEEFSQLQVLEFISESYSYVWQSILKNENKSMVTVMMKMFQNKNLSQKTNDSRAKALIDYVMAPSGVESVEMLLFGYLLGLQPKTVNVVSPAWAQIAASVIVAHYCERCLKNGQLNDASGEPSYKEFRGKLQRETRNRSQKFKTNEVITVKKALRIIALLCDVKQPYWTIAPMTASCVEFNTRLPWTDNSLSKLLSMLFYVALNGIDHMPGDAAPSNSRSTFMTNKDNKAAAASANTTTIMPPITAPHGLNKSNNNNTNTKGPEKLLSRNNSHTGKTKMTRTSSGGVISSNAADNSNEKGTSGGDSGSGSNGANKTQRTRLKCLKSLDRVAEKIWKGKAHPTLSKSRSVGQICEYLKNIHTEENPSYIQTNIDRASYLGENLTISIYEVAYVCVVGWCAEYNSIRTELEQGGVTSSRRKAICGHYDSSHASMNSIERLALTRLLHWYTYARKEKRMEQQRFQRQNSNYKGSRGGGGGVTYDDEGNLIKDSADQYDPFNPGNEGEDDDGDGLVGIDWDDFESKYASHSFPFSIPASLTFKSRNELNFLCQQLAKEMAAQKIIDETNDRTVSDGPYAPQAKAIVNGGTTKLIVSGGKDLSNDDYLTAEEIDKFYRGAYLSSQTLGGGENDPWRQASLNSDPGGQVNKFFDKVENRMNSPPKSPSAAESNAAAVQRDMQVVEELYERQLGGHSGSKIVPNTTEVATTTVGGLRAAHLSPLGGRLSRPTSASAMASGSGSGSSSSNYNSVSGGGEAEHKGTEHSEKNLLQAMGPQAAAALATNAANLGAQQHSKVENITRSTYTGGSHGSRPSSGTGRPKTPLSRLPYESPVPGPQTIHMVDELGMANAPSVLTNAKLLEPTHYNGSAHDPNHQPHKHDHHHHHGNHTFPKHASGKEMTPLEKQMHMLKSGGGDGIGATAGPSAQRRDALNLKLSQLDPSVRKEIIKEREDKVLDEMEQSVYQSVGEEYSSVVTQSRRTALGNARDRVALRVRLKERQELAAQVNGGDSLLLGGESSSIISTAAPTSYTETSNYLNKKNRITQFMDLTLFIDQHGEFTTNMANELSAESVIKILAARNAKISTATLNSIVANYCKPWQMDLLIKLDLSGNKLGPAGAALLGERIGKCKTLVHLNLSSTQLGDLGVKKLLQCLTYSSGSTGNKNYLSNSLKRLELRDNSITIATEAFSLLGQLTALRALDISRNSFTLDSSLQCDMFTVALSPLKNLESLSVAFNKIQDAGLKLVVETIKLFLPNVKILDVAGCFLSKASRDTIIEALEIKSTDDTNSNEYQIEELILQENILSYAVMEELTRLFGNSKVSVKMDGPYYGIAFPLRYELSDYGIDDVYYDL